MKKRQLLAGRAIALLLLVATLLTATPTVVLAGELADYVGRGEELGTVVILHDGLERSSVTLIEGERETLRAYCKDGEPDGRAWQILIPGTDIWVDINGKNGETLDVSLAIIGSLLDSAGCAKLRHEITVGGKSAYSDPVEIVVAYRAHGAPALTLPDAEEEATAETVRYLSAAEGAEAPAAEGDDTDENVKPLVSIIIKYLFDNGGIAAEPAGATIVKGSEFSKTFKSPTVRGYEPYRRVEILDASGNVIGSEYVEADEVVIDVDALNEDLVINVIYEPALVKYQVHHHFQDLYDDAYPVLPDKITEYYALTGSKVPDNLKEEFPGFTALDYNAELTVAADGSTVVEIQYERNYYLVTFDMNGGYGTDPVYTRFAAPVGANQPVRHGYLFDGWNLVSYGDAPPSDAQRSEFDLNGAGKTITLPAANLVYRARWITQLTTYTMVFWQENINDNGYTYWGYLDGLAAMSGTLVSGADRISEVAGIDDEKYFTYCDVLTDKDVIVEGDGSTVVNVYYTRNRYAITFKGAGNCAIEAGHTHTRDECYITLCQGNHVHTEECNPTIACGKEEHTAHTDACLVCSITVHTHTAECTCGTEEHTHVKACWPSAGAVANKPTRAPASPETGYIYKSGSKYYIYIKGTWYSYSGRNVSTGSVVDPSCKKDEHTHTGECNRCDLTEHTHGDGCYRDSLHTHTSTCYKYSCGAVAHTHTDACYLLNCGMPVGHSHSSDRAGSNTVKIVYRKYQQSIDDIWPIEDENGKVYDNGERWKPSGSSLYSQVLVYLSDMPPESFTLTVDESSNSAYTMMYYLEVLPGETFDATYNGRNYALHKTIKAKYSYLTEAEDYFPINGFTKGGSTPSFKNNQVQISSGDKTVKMYYNRNVSQKLEFNNNGAVIDQKTQTGIMYGASISDKYFVPEYPSNLEEGAFVFGGWYTTSECFPGTEVDWESLTMPAGDLMLYASWRPVVYNVEIYTELKDGEYVGKIGVDQSVSHNHFALAPKTTPLNGSYIFKGWFYIDRETGEETAFVFTGIPVTQDLKIYAKWSSRITVNYKINYVLHGTNTPIADPTVGGVLAGDNKTFHAKVEGELYEPYRQGYYPLFNSHTVTMSADKDYREFTFEYVYKETMPYAVRYVNAKGESLLKDDNGNTIDMIRYTDNTRVVVTETFRKFPGMMPDSYQKRLALSASGEDADRDGILDNNVITFRYTEDLEHAYYRVVHYIQEIDNNKDYREYRSEEVKGTIKDVLTFNPITVAGFGFVNVKVNGEPYTPGEGGTVTATLGTDGLLVEFYYDRANVKYTVNYLERDTGAVLAEPKIAYAPFGSQVVEQGPKLLHLGYTMNAATVEQTYQRLHLSTDPEKNVINFYYTENQCTIEYRIIGDAEGGRLSVPREYVYAVSDDAEGVSIYLDNAYKFLGWFSDEACTVPVPAEWVDAANKLTPEKDGVWTSNLTYYAKIEPNVSTLTISAEGTSNVDVDQTYIFLVKGTSAAVQDIEFTVTVAGNSSVTISDLLIGEYTVTELTDWSFRYSVANAEKKVSMVPDGTKNKVSFGHVRTLTRWLDGNADILFDLFD